MQPTSNFIVLSVLMLLHGCYSISDPDIWPKDFVQKNILPELIGKSETVVLEKLGPPKFVVSEKDATSYVYEKVEDDTSILMIGYIPFPPDLFSPYKGHETSCVLLEFDDNDVLQKYKIHSRGAASEADTDGFAECAELFGIRNNKNMLQWCLYESIGHNEDVMAIDVVEEYQWYKLQTLEDTTRFQWLCRAADHGHPNAQAEVGRHHLKGLNSLQKDLTRAYVWYTLSASSSCFSYSYAFDLQKLTREMTSEQIAQAEKQLQNWGPGLCEHELIPVNTGN
jgi:hypothetical protein